MILICRWRSYMAMSVTYSKMFLTSPTIFQIFLYIFLFLSLGVLRLHMWTTLHLRIHLQIVCVILFFFCRHIRIRFDPILLPQLLSKLIGLFIVVIVIWEHNVLCSKCLFFCVLHHQAIFHAHWQHCSSEGFICFDLH